MRYKTAERLLNKCGVRKIFENKEYALSQFFKCTLLTILTKNVFQ